MIRKFEYRQGGSNKFWAIEKDETSLVLIVNYGKIGTKGSFLEHPYQSVSQMNKTYQRLINSKLAKGYREVIVSTHPLDVSDVMYTDGNIKCELI